MRILLLVVFYALVPTSFTFASGGRLFTVSGNRASVMTELVLSQDMADTVADSTLVFENGQQVMAQLISNASVIARRLPPKDATTLQVEELTRSKVESLREIMSPMPGRALSISFRIDDIIARSPPREPSPLAETATKMEKVAYNQAYQQYLSDNELFEKQRFLIVGRIRIPGRPADPKILKEMGAAGKAHREAMKSLTKQIADAKLPATKEYLQNRRQSAERAHKTRMTELRRRAAESQLGRNYVYILSSDEALTNWRKGQTRNLNVFIQTIALFNDAQSRYSTSPPVPTRSNTGRASSQGDRLDTERVLQEENAASFVNTPNPRFAVELIVHMMQDRGESEETIDVESTEDEQLGEDQESPDTENSPRTPEGEASERDTVDAAPQ